MAFYRPNIAAMLESDARTSLQHLSGVPTGMAYTLNAVSRECYASIEPPPTPRHQQYVILTRWRLAAAGFIPVIPESHEVLASSRPDRFRLRQVIDMRPGAFWTAHDGP